MVKILEIHKFINKKLIQYVNFYSRQTSYSVLHIVGLSKESVSMESMCICSVANLYGQIMITITQILLAFNVHKT